jgi:putative CocE/NonD family hydrolase
VIDPDDITAAKAGAKSKTPDEIDCRSSSNCFLRGHRIRVEISSSNFPQFDRNPNTGHAFGMDAELRTATQTIYHDAARPSQVVLPVVDVAGQTASP